METLEKKAAEMLQKSEVVVLTSINQEGYPRPVPMSMVKAEGISTVWMSTAHGKQLIFARIRKVVYVSMPRETVFA